jgi:hypothetical protein
VSKGFPGWSPRRGVGAAAGLVSTMYLPLATAELFKSSLPHAGSGSSALAGSPARVLGSGLILVIGVSVGVLLARWLRVARQEAWIGKGNVRQTPRSLGLAVDVRMAGGCLGGAMLMAGAGSVFQLLAGGVTLLLVTVTTIFLEAWIIATYVNSPEARLRLRWFGIRLAVLGATAVTGLGIWKVDAPQWLRFAVVAASLVLGCWVVLRAGRVTGDQP